MEKTENKNLKKCKYCQTEIDSKAKVCPNCKKSQGLETWAKVLIIIGVIITCLIGCVSSCAEAFDDTITVENNETKKDSTDNTKSNSSKKKEKFSYTVSSEYNDYSFHYIEGTVKNNLNKDYSYVQIEFVCYDSEGNNLGTAIDNTNNLLANETWKFKAMGLFTEGNVDHCDFHEVTGW